VEVRRDVLEEQDGPMLRHGLQEIAGAAIQVPRDRGQQPNRAFLEARYALFKRAG
jgi:putative restriction endonuclease